MIDTVVRHTFAIVKAERLALYLAYRLVGVDVCDAVVVSADAEHGLSED